MSDPRQLASAGMVRNAMEAAQTWLDRDSSIAVATVIGTWGSAPVPVGGQMVIARDGSFHGSVSGGCVEGEVIAEAEDVLESGEAQTLTFGVSDETAWGVGLPCGGEIKVYLERLEAEGPDREFVSKALKAHERRDGLIVATNLNTGARTLYTRDSSNLPDGVMQRFRSGKSEIAETADGPVFYQTVLPPARTIVIGATHIAQLFAQIGQMAGYEVIIVDPRTAFASADRFPGVELHAEWPQDILPQLGLDPYTAMVVVAHVSHIDDEALKIALRSECLYIGALGSKRNHEKRTERLRAAGFSADEIARIKCPIGLDIGAQSPAEIAISIMAEVVLAVRGPKYEQRKAAA